MVANPSTGQNKERHNFETYLDQDLISKKEKKILFIFLVEEDYSWQLLGTCNVTKIGRFQNHNVQGKDIIVILLLCIVV